MRTPLSPPSSVQIDPSSEQVALEPEAIAPPRLEVVVRLPELLVAELAGRSTAVRRLSIGGGGLDLGDRDRTLHRRLGVDRDRRRSRSLRALQGRLRLRPRLRIGRELERGRRLAVP